MPEALDCARVLQIAGKVLRVHSGSAAAAIVGDYDACVGVPGDEFSFAFNEKRIALKEIVERHPDFCGRKRRLIDDENASVPPGYGGRAVEPGKAARGIYAPLTDQVVFLRASAARNRDDGRMDAGKKLQDGRRFAAAARAGMRALKCIMACVSFLLKRWKNLIDEAKTPHEMHEKRMFGHIHCSLVFFIAAWQEKSQRETEDA